MRHKILLSAAIAGAVLGTLSMEVRADGWHHGRGWGRPYRGWGGLSFVIDTRPNYVAMPNYGYPAAVGSPYDILYYNNLYYLYNDSVWYRSSYYSGPWVVVTQESLPETVRKQRMEEIRRSHDLELRDTDLPKSAGHRDDRNSSSPDSGEGNDSSRKAQ